MDIQKEMCIIEAMLFSYGTLVTPRGVAGALEIEEGKAKEMLERVAEMYNRAQRGIMIRKIEDGYQLCSRNEYHEYISKLYPDKTYGQLSQASLETLSIIAYNAPITRARIEKVRGVNSDSSVATLMERNLITVIGRMDVPGRPLLYETTKDFLRSFGFSTLEDLPLVEMEDKILEKQEELKG